MDILNNINSPVDIKNLSLNELDKLSQEMRNYLLESVSKTGGHLASNLGVVELTLALHKTFDSPKDKIIWDVGHQAYVHKVLTGRKDQFHTLRKYKGLSGFPKRNESEHDIFETGHSSTSISAALGMAKARDLKNENYSVIAVIGDGALTGGMAFEALNHAGHEETDLIVVLNDNEMSISENVGGLSTYLNRLRTNPTYYKAKVDVENILNKIPTIGKTVFKTAEKAKDSIKYFLVPGVIFEELGFTYLGPVDGHDIKELNVVMERAKQLKGPVLIHVKTCKGKGYEFAEKNPDKFHGIAPFDINTGTVLSKGKKNLSYSKVFGNSMVDLAKKDNKVVAITAAMPSGTGLNDFETLYPDRFFDVGIAEQHAVTFAAGLAANGYKPVFVVYSTFLQRAYDQILHDVCLQNLPVIFAIDRAGLVGNDGETHHGVFDLSFLSHMPNMHIMAPKDGRELDEMLASATKMNGPVAIRYPRGESEDFTDVGSYNAILNNRSEILLTGKDICIIAVGAMVKVAYDAAIKLKEKNISCTVINARFIKPLDEKLIIKEAAKFHNIITLEDNVVKGGFGSQIMELFSRKGLTNKSLLTLGFPDKFVYHGSREELMQENNLDVNGIVIQVERMLNRRDVLWGKSLG